MNKTPQEQAEEMVFDLQLNSWSKTHILESIPLPELIAVAQAAKLVLLAPRRTEIQELNALEQTFKALRATGKVEL